MAQHITRWISWMVIGLVCACGTAQAEDFLAIDVPGAQNGTYPFGINASGQVVGYYYTDAFNPHGFLRQPSGAIVSIDVPGATGGTLPAAINARGDIAGSYYDAAGGHGFVLRNTGQVLTFDVPGARHTFAWDINAHGDVVGYWFDDGFTFHGFLRTANGDVTSIDVADSYATQLFGINADGVIVGRRYGAWGGVGTIRYPDGTVADLNVSGSGDNFPYAISNQGAVAGSYNFPAAGFVRDAEGHETTIRVPGAHATLIYRMNERGHAVGVVYPTPGVWVGHGFLMR